MGGALGPGRGKASVTVAAGLEASVTVIMHDCGMPRGACALCKSDDGRLKRLP